MDVPRRNFVAAAAVAGVAANAGIALAGETQTVVECDIAIVGAGGSGLAAAVEAAEAGVKVVVLERMPYAGGGELGVEGIFAVNSSMQQAEGIELSAGELVKAELVASQQRASGPAYVDLVHATGANIDWLIEHGVTFEGVDADTGVLKLFHRFEGDAGAFGSTDRGPVRNRGRGRHALGERLHHEHRRRLQRQQHQLRPRRRAARPGQVAAQGPFCRRCGRRTTLEHKPRIPQRLIGKEAFSSPPYTKPPRPSSKSRRRPRGTRRRARCAVRAGGMPGLDINHAISGQKRRICNQSCKQWPKSTVLRARRLFSCACGQARPSRRHLTRVSP